jgi:uncharacterized protein (DUF1778 family)
MATNESSKEKARFDIRLTKEQKAFFERAARLGGFRSLTDFVVLTVQEKANQIIDESKRVIASQRDSEIFFDAITNPGKPNQKLLEAANDFNELLSK